MIAFLFLTIGSVTTIYLPVVYYQNVYSENYILEKNGYQIGSELELILVFLLFFCQIVQWLEIHIFKVNK